jgi:hypothetical protein
LKSSRNCPGAAKFDRYRNETRPKDASKCSRFQSSTGQSQGIIPAAALLPVATSEIPSMPFTLPATVGAYPPVAHYQAHYMNYHYFHDYGYY